MALETFARQSLAQFIIIYGEIFDEKAIKPSDLEHLMWGRMCAKEANINKLGFKIPYDNIRRSKVTLPYLPDDINYTGCPVIKKNGGLYTPCCGKIAEESFYCKSCSVDKEGNAKELEFGTIETRDANVEDERFAPITFGEWMKGHNMTLTEVYAKLAAGGVQIEIPADQLMCRELPKRRKGRPAKSEDSVVDEDTVKPKRKAKKGSDSEEEKPKEKPKKASPKASPAESEAEKPKKVTKAKKVPEPEPESESEEAPPPKKASKASPKASPAASESETEKPKKASKPSPKASPAASESDTEKPKKKKAKEPEPESEEEAPPPKKASPAASESETEKPKKATKKAPEPEPEAPKAKAKKVEKEPKAAKEPKAKAEKPKAKGGGPEKTKAKAKVESDSEDEMPSKPTKAFKATVPEIDLEELAAGFEEDEENEDVEATIDDVDYIIRNGKFVCSIDSGEILGTVDGDEVVWNSEKR